MENSKLINKALLDKYGKDANGFPMYRLVQNYNLTEKRRGTFPIFFGNAIVAWKDDIAEVPKYNYVPAGYWILEKLFYTTNPEIISTVSYEPLWVFRDPKTDEYQKPYLEACEFIITCALRGPDEAIKEAKEKEDKEEQLFYEMLGGDAGVSEKLMTQEAVSMVGLDAVSAIKNR